MNRPTHYISCVLVDFAGENPEVAPLPDHPAGSAFERIGASGAFEAVALE